MRVLITGASGCIGHHVAEVLLGETAHELFLLVRDPARLRLDWRARPGAHLVVGDLRALGPHAALLATVDAAVLAATAWGGAREVEEVNVAATLALLDRLEAARGPILYFSTASILDHDHRPLPEAETLGTPYIRSKAAAARAVRAHRAAPRVVTLYPTVVLGGDATRPPSHAATLAREALRWVRVLRFLRADGSFHFIHARDVARVVAHLLAHPGAVPPARELVLGNPAVTVNEAIAAACAVTGTPRTRGLPLGATLTRALLALARVGMTPWDRACLARRHLVHRDPASPASFGLPVAHPTLASVLRPLAGTAE